MSAIFQVKNCSNSKNTVLIAIIAGKSEIKIIKIKP